MSRRLHPLAFLCAVLFLSLGSVGYVATVVATPPYFIRTWQVEDGLPQNKVTAAVQTRDGYLWLGTYSGLARFDGVRFEVFDDSNTPELHSSRVTSLCEVDDGTLWIGDESGQVTKFKGGKFEAVALQPKWHGGKIYDIATDESSDVWLMNESGELARARDGLVLTPRAGPVAKVVAMSRSDEGTIWIARDGAVSMLKHGQLTAIEFDGATGGYVQGIGASRDGGLWVASNEHIRKWKAGQWVQDLGTAPWGGSIITRLVEMKDGVLVAGTTDNGLYLISPGNVEPPLHFNHANGLPSDWMISLWEDREKNLWIGTGAGLVVMRPNNITTISPPDQWKGRAVLAICPAKNGALWIGTEGAGLYRYQNGAWTNFNAAQGIRNPYIWSLAEDERGRLWVGTWGGGLFVQKGDAFDYAPGMENITPPMPAMLSRSNGLWLGTTMGLLRYQDGTTTWYDHNDGQTLNDVRCIAQDKQGVIWFGTAGNGLACLDKQTIRHFKKADGLSSDFIECLYFDDDGTLWIGTFGGGLNRLKKGRFTVINRKQGLLNSVIGDIEPDGRGYFWLSSYGGILRVSRSELNRCADGEIKQVNCLTYGINDGLPTLECSEGLQPAGCKTPDGRLWFPTGKGLVAVFPDDVRTNPLPPPVIIEAMQVDDQVVEPKSTAAPLKIPPGRHRFEFQYTGLSFVTPEKVHFRHWLEGAEADWTEVGNQRVVNYSYIPPGDYIFHVTACNNDGVWNKTGVTLAFTVLPYFWQTVWFRIFAGVMTAAISGGMVWLSMRRRLREKLERVERQRAVEQERSRIAHDIHDDLGSHLTRITMLSESARGELDSPAGAAADISQIYDTARDLTRAMDEIVWAVNPKHDTLESLASYLEKFAQDFLGSAGIRCRLDLPVQFPDWLLTADVRHNVFLAFKEAVNNAVKHAAADEVRIVLTLQPAAFQLEVADNGRGFKFQPGLKTGNGLDNMVLRLRAADGRCEIHSEPGQGTQVIFFVPKKISRDNPRKQVNISVSWKLTTAAHAL